MICKPYYAISTMRWLTKTKYTGGEKNGKEMQTSVSIFVDRKVQDMHKQKEMPKSNQKEPPKGPKNGTFNLDTCSNHYCSMQDYAQKR